MPRRSRRSAYLILYALALTPATAAAQARTVLVLPWSLEGGDAATLAARAESVVSATGTGESSPLSIADARSRFAEHGSAEPPTMSDSDLDRWLSLSRQAVRHLAHADYTAAAATLREAQSLYEPATAELNREETRARQVLDTCLYEVRALVETDDPRARRARSSVDDWCRESRRRPTTTLRKSSSCCVAWTLASLRRRRDRSGSRACRAAAEFG
jgi:hypothetical protein